MSENKEPEWNGAQHMRNRHMLDRAGNFDRGFGGVKSPSTGVICDPMHRDIGHVFPFLMKESLLAATQLLYTEPENEDAIVALDTIGQFMAKIWNESLTDNLGGLQLFEQLYGRVREIPGGPEAYTAFTTYFVQSYFCYLFTVQKMAIGLVPLTADSQEMQAMYTVLSGLSEGTRKTVIQEWRDNGIWPSNISYGKLLRRMEDFTEVVKEGQRLRIEQDAAMKKAQEAPIEEGESSSEPEEYQPPGADDECECSLSAPLGRFDHMNYVLSEGLAEREAKGLTAHTLICDYAYAKLAKNKELRGLSVKVGHPARILADSDKGVVQVLLHSTLYM